MLAHITVSTYQDALPLYRQETILRRIGMDIPRSTLSQWMIKAVRDTGQGMQDKYKDTAGGGLAVNVMEMPVNFVEC